MTPPFTKNVLESLTTDLVSTLKSTPEAPVLCTDLRDTSVSTPQGADRIRSLMFQTNELFSRSALLLPSSPTLFLQFERVIREASNPARRAFRDVLSLRGYLGEVLNEAERERLAKFLAEANQDAHVVSGRRSPLPVSRV